MSKRTAIAALITLATAFGAQAQTAAPSYDYASKFYPHPAWLYLSSEAPREMHEHPAVVMHREAQKGRMTVAEASGKFYPHPAWMYLLAEQPHEMSDHPAVIVARRAQAEEAARLAAARAVVAQR